MKDAYLTQLNQFRKKDLFRDRTILSSSNGRQITTAGQTLINFSSNNYLDLVDHAAPKKAFNDAAAHYGMGAGASQFISGYTLPLHKLEEELAMFTGRDRAILFSSTYLANLAAVTALADCNSAVFADRLSHASLIDAAILSRARFRRYQHGDTAALTKYLSAGPATSLVITDGVFSMDGDLAPLPELARCSHQYDATLIVDDAHGIGVLGRKGGGTLEYLALDQTAAPLLVAGFGKAFGLSGAFIAGPDLLIETILQKGHSAIYTTAMMPALASAVSASLRIITKETWRRERLYELIGLFNETAAHYGLSIIPSSTPIQSAVIGSNQAVTTLSRRLYETGFYVPAIRAPTVPKGTERLRISITLAHSEEDIRSLLACLASMIG